MEEKFRLRYYFDKELVERWKYSMYEWDKKAFERHNKVVSLLSEIKKLYNIDYELFGFFRGDIERIYKEHFVSRAKTLSKVLDESPARALKSRSGYIYMHDVIAIVENDVVIWFNRGYWRDYEKWKGYDNDRPMTIGFLKCVLNEPEYLKELLKEIKIIEATKKSVHEELVEQFISRIKTGSVEREVEIGKGFIVYDKWGSPKTVGKLKIDIVWKIGDETYVIEVKEQLNFEAIGQAIVYKELYKKEHPNENVRSGIFCKVADKEILEVAEKYIDRIWCYEVREKGAIDWSKVP